MERIRRLTLVVTGGVILFLGGLLLVCSALFGLPAKALEKASDYLAFAAERIGDKL